MVVYVSAVLCGVRCVVCCVLCVVCCVLCVVLLCVSGVVMLCEVVSGDVTCRALTHTHTLTHPHTHTQMPTPVQFKEYTDQLTPAQTVLLYRRAQNPVRVCVCMFVYVCVCLCVCVLCGMHCVVFMCAWVSVGVRGCVQ